MYNNFVSIILKIKCAHIPILIATLLIYLPIFAQQKTAKDTTFFLLKKKGLLKKLGKSIYREPPIENGVTDVIKNVDPFLQYQGKRIRSITVAPTGFYTIVNDTAKPKGKFIEKVGDAFHKNTLTKVVRKNLFFKIGDKILARLISDNERFLREQPFFRDAKIVLVEDTLSAMVDVLVLTRDVFSIGASANVSSLTKVATKINDENIFGSGNTLEFSNLYDFERKQKVGIGALLLKRNVSGTFINWATGFKTFNNAFSSGRQEENSFFTSFTKPMLTRYNAYTGAANFSYSFSKNQYYTDSVYAIRYQYKLFDADVWGGFNIGYKNKKERDSDKRLRHFVAMRGLYRKFYEVPQEIKNSYNPTYANLNSLLVSYSLYKQNFYRTNFIYGFGRNEDVPKGLNATALAGYTNKQGIKRMYYGLEFDATTFSKKGYFASYIFKVGTFINNKNFQDFDVLIGINNFSKLHKISTHWRNRNFLSLNYTKQINVLLNAPLNLQSAFAQPNFTSNGIPADTRSTLKLETVFYNLKKILGFRLAPFAFSDVSLLKPIGQQLYSTTGYTAIGGGLRARNENLTFGTVELKGFYFPKDIINSKNWRVEVSTKLRFNFNTNFIRKPDFVSPN